MNSSVYTISVLILCSALLGSIRVFGRPSTTSNGRATTFKEFYVTRFGAVGDGKKDDTRAFQSVWEAACKNQTNAARIIVPKGKTFLVNAVQFQGPCKPPSIVYQILGRIVAPARSAWRRTSTNIWLYFLQVDGLSLEGNGLGMIDGAGDTWWKYMNDSARPTAMRFSQCNRLQMRGLKHINSQMNHIALHSCNGSIISNLDIRAPEDSPNTDGIDLSHCKNVNIHDCNIATGDDCIAINEDTSDVQISHIACGPGHGISIGSLGNPGHPDHVERINVTSCSFTRTQNGVRIKTYQGGSGYARSIRFTNITFTAAGNPVMIDQYYCPHNQCNKKANQRSAVEISDVGFYGLRGTTINKNETVSIKCSQSVPCKSIILDDVNIRSQAGSTSAVCINAYGRANTSSPVVTCLKAR